MNARNRSYLKSFLTAALLIVFTCTAAWAHEDGRTIKIMTRNLYQGTDFTEAMSSQTQLEFFTNVTLTMNNVRATNPPARMAAIAAEIAEQEPDLVGLQEATIWQTGPAFDQLKTEFDLGQLVMRELVKLKVEYVPIVVFKGFDFLSPGITGEWVHTTQCNMILARKESLDDGMKVLATDKAAYSVLLPVPIAALGTSLTIPRGWASADISFHGLEFRFITTQAEAFFDDVEIAQIAELVTGTPVATALPIVIAGDFNAHAEDPTSKTYFSYALAQQFGFVDAWTNVHLGAPGFNCCQDNNLVNKKSKLNQRLDLVMVRGALDVRGMKLAGNTEADRIWFWDPKFTLWPSDHAGAVTKLRLMK